MTMVAHVAMQEAADRASTLVLEDHVRASIVSRGIVLKPRPVAAPEPPPTAHNGATEPVVDERPMGFFSRLFARRA